MAVKEIHSDFNKYNSLTPVAEMIAIYGNDGKFKGYVDPRNYKKEMSQRLYTFGLISDLHNNEGLTGSTTDNDEDMANAMAFFKNNGVDFVACCGDVFSTANNEGMFQKFQQVKNANLGSIPFFACSGNHDCATSTDGDGTVDNNLWNTYLGTNKSFVITHNELSSLPNDDVLIFFGESYNKFVNGTGDNPTPIQNKSPYTDEDIEWLRTQLATYKDKRVFVFNHLFFPGTTDAQDAYVQSSMFMSPLLGKVASLAYMYKNTIWFNGHNHWAYKEQVGDKKANVCDSCEYSSEGLTMAPQVHVSSCGATREVNLNSGDKYHRNELAGNSEGAIVEVYEDCMVYRCISFSTTAQNYINKFLPLANYTIPFTKKAIPNWQIIELTDPTNQLVSGNIGSTTDDGSVESNAKYIVSVNYISIDPNRKYFIAVSRPVAGRQNYLGNFSSDKYVSTWHTSDSNTTPRLCQLFFHVYNTEQAYLGYVLNPREGFPENYYFNDMMYFQDITDNIFGTLGNTHNSGTPAYLKFRIEPGTNANTSVSAVSGIAKQFSIFSCTKDEWDAMNQ